MGRTPKRVIDEIRSLHAQGFLNKEIAEKVGKTEKTVAGYLENKDVKGCANETVVLFESFFGLLEDLNTFSVLDQEALGAMVNLRTVQTIRKLFQVNPNLAKRLLDPQIKRLKELRVLDLKVLDEELSPADRALRSEWEALLKESYPEKLAALV